MSFIVLEGIDGSGKSTQINLLQQYLKDRNIKYKYLHFPRTDSPVYGELISMFLRGELGDINTVNPYLIALIYAGDRNNAKPTINKWLEQEYLVIVDRYVYSNVAYQCAKLICGIEKNKLSEWIKYFEFEYNKIPVPDLSIFLDVSSEFTKEKLTSPRRGGDRDYLKGKKDIHEQSLVFQQKAREEYISLTKKNENFHLINCGPYNNNILSPEEIFNKMLDVLIKNEILDQ